MGLDTVELVMEIEREFGIDIPDAEAEKIRTVGMLADYVWGAISQGVPKAPLPPAPIHPASTSSHTQVLRRVRELVAEQFGARLEDVQSHTRFVEDLNAD